MKKRIRLVGVDMDGTLLTSEKKVSAYSKQMIQTAVDQGVIILPATGRPFNGIPAEVKAVPGMRYALTTNGARVMDTQTGEILIEHLLDRQLALDCLKVLAKYDTLLEVYYDGVGYAVTEQLKHIEHYHHDAAMWGYVLSTRESIDDIFGFVNQESRGVEKVQGIFANLEEKALAQAELAALSTVVATSSLGYNLEINGAGVNKGTSLIELGALLGISRDEIMGIGDADNDADMLREAGLGVAMANAHQSIKDIADYVTASNDEDGVALAIKKFCIDANV